MKLKRCSSFCVGFYFIGVVIRAQAGSLHWDGDSFSPNADGGYGVWSAAALPENWDTSNSAGLNSPWVAGSDAVFGGIGGVVTVSGVVSASSLTFTAPGYRLQGGQVSLTGSPVISTGSHDVVLESPLAGAAPITKTGTGALTLRANNSFSGSLTIAEGKVIAGQSFVLGGSPSHGTTIEPGATFEINGKNNGGERFTASGAGVGGTGAIINTSTDSGVSTHIYDLTLAGDTVVGGTRDWVIASGGSVYMSGHSLTKVGSNRLGIGAGFAVPGRINIEEGTVTLHEFVNLNGNAANVISVQDGATLEVMADRNLVWTQTLESGSTLRASGTAGWDGPTILNGAALFEAMASTTPMVHRGVISGSGSMTKTGAGNWVLTAASTHSGGTTVNAGALVLDPAFTSGEGVLRGTVTVNQGGILSLKKGNSLGTAVGARVESLNLSGGMADNTSSASNSAPLINLSNGGLLRSNGGVNSPEAASCFTLSDDAVINGLPGIWTPVISGRLHLGAGNTGNTTVFQIADGPPAEDLRIEAAVTADTAANGITKRGTGVLSLHGPALYEGDTVVEGGTLLLEGGGSLPASRVIVGPGARAGTTSPGVSFASLTAQAGSSLILPAVSWGSTVVEGTLLLAGGNISICPVMGDVAAPGVYDLVVADQITGSGMPVVDFSGAFGASHATGTVVVNGNKLQLIVSDAGKELLWTNATEAGAANGTWDYSRANFSDGSANETFRTFDAVTFDDTVAPAVTRYIDFASVLAPARVTVNNSNGAYFFNGSLSGVGSLVKTGSSRLTVGDYAMTGPIFAGGGALNLGFRPIVTAGLTLASGASIENATITTGGMDLQAGSATALLRGNAPWTKTTPGTVTLTANNKLTGFGTIAAGHLIVGNSATPNASGALGSGPLAIASGAALTICRGGSTTPTDVVHAFSGNGGLALVGNNDGMSGYSTFNLPGDNRSFSGPVTVSNARLSLTSGNEAGSGPITLSGRGALFAVGATVSNPITCATSGTWGDNMDAFTRGNLSLLNAKLTGALTLAGSVPVSVTSPNAGASHSLISGPIGQSGGPASVSFGSVYSGNSFTLSGNSTYTGSTLIGGSVAVNLTGSLGATAVSVASLGTLAGNGVIGAGGSLTFASNSKLKVDNSSQALTVNGDVNLGTKTLIVVDVAKDAVMDGPFPVLRYTGTLTGGVAQLAIAASPTVRKSELALAPGLITLDIGSKALIWKGGVDDVWRSGSSTTRWGTTNEGPAVDSFYSGDRVEFNDSAAGGIVRGATSAVRPSSVVVSNSIRNYHIATAIEGPCELIKQGTGLLTLSGNNSYSGGTIAHAGRLEIISASPLGTGPVTIAAAATLAGNGTTSGALTLAGTLDPGLTGGTWATLSTGTTVLSGNYRCDLSSAACDLLSVTGDLDLTGATLSLIKSSPTLAGSYVIATYTGTLSGRFASVRDMPPGYIVKYDTAAKRILVTSAADFAEWSASFSHLGDITADGDPDFDGVPSLIEYVIGGNPGAEDSALLPTQTLSASHLVFRYKRGDASPASTVQTVQWSPDMKTWADITIPQTSSGPVQVISNGSDPDEIIVTIPRLPGQMYVRLRVTQP